MPTITHLTKKRCIYFRNYKELSLFLYIMKDLLIKNIDEDFVVLVDKENVSYVLESNDEAKVVLNEETNVFESVTITKQHFNPDLRSCGIIWHVSTGS